MIARQVYHQSLRHARRRPFAITLESLEPRTLLSTGPRITAITPTEVINATFDHIDVTFNESIDPTTFTTGDVTMTGPADRGRSRSTMSSRSTVRTIRSISRL